MLGPAVRAESPEVNENSLCPSITNHLAGDIDEPMRKHRLLYGAQGVRREKGSVLFRAKSRRSPAPGEGAGESVF